LKERLIGLASLEPGNKKLGLLDGPDSTFIQISGEQDSEDGDRTGAIL
jgi:hypothetical protein